MVCIQRNNDNGIREFRFYDGTPMPYFNWNSGQPQGGDDHHIIMRREYNYLWHDFVAIYTSSLCIYICENQLSFD